MVAFAIFPFYPMIGINENSVTLPDLDPDNDYIYRVYLRFIIHPCLPKLGSFVGIDIPVAHLSFAQAKVIDLLWNTVVGRGFQLIFGYLTYRVFMDGVIKALEAQAMPIDTVVNILLFTPQVAPLWTSAKAAGTVPGWRMKCLLLWTLVSIIFLAVLPSLLDLASGYDARQVFSLVQPDGVIFPLDSSDGTPRTSSS